MTGFRPMRAHVELDAEACGSGNDYNGNLGLRIGAIFVILVTSLFGVLLPIVSRRTRLPVPEMVYDFVRYFGSGVIIATAFIHLLAPAWDALTSPCLSGTWTEYDWTPALAMLAIFVLFIVELIAHRSGARYLRKHGLKPNAPHSDAHKEIGHTMHGAHVDEERAHPSGSSSSDVTPNFKSEEAGAQDDLVFQYDDAALAQLVGVAILEFGVVLHSFTIGLALAVSDEFVTLFVVLIFHQMFEGLGLGSRLSLLRLPSHLSWTTYAAGIFYAFVTPVGTAIGLGIRTTYNPGSATASIVTGTLDALSAGVLIYTGLVELMAHDFVFNRHMAVEASNAKVAFSVGSVVLGAGLMSLLGRWA